MTLQSALGEPGATTRAKHVIICSACDEIDPPKLTSN